jgi:pyruvate-ferredoxin/flavodoxin oxidoreductase
MRYYALALTRPFETAELLRQAQAGVPEKYRTYEEFTVLRTGPTPARATTAAAKTQEPTDSRK